MVSADLLSCRSSQLIKLLSPAGYLSNVASSPSSPSSAADCVDGGPEWLIEAGPGQRINITLWDFGRRFQADSLPRTRLSGCVKYATVTEMNSVDRSDEKIVCGAQPTATGRLHYVYTSVGNAVKIRLHVIANEHSESQSSSTPRFLIHYQS